VVIDLHEELAKTNTKGGRRTGNILLQTLTAGLFSHGLAQVSLLKTQTEKFSRPDLVLFDKCKYFHPDTGTFHVNEII
jgi:hypothetical protein